MTAPTALEWQEKLKETQAQSNRAIASERSRSYQQAFELYVQSAQSYLYLIRHFNVIGSRSSTSLQSLKVNSGTMLDRAEKMKRVKDSVGIISSEKISEGQRKKTVIAGMMFSRENQDRILSHSSRIDSQYYPPWSSEPNAKVKPCYRPSFSHDQLERSPTWKRAQDIFSESLKSGDSDGGKKPFFSMVKPNLEPQELVQDVISDCSLVAGLASCIENSKRWSKPVPFACIYPQDENGVPQLNDEGVYGVRLFINGTWRRINVDDAIPASKTGDVLCVSTEDKAQLWPALIEKAYLSVMGGYGFPGSNSSIDIYAVTGWIPEHVPLHGASFKSEAGWDLLADNFNQGRCLLTVGTGDLSDAERSLTGLVPNHAYSIVYMYSKNGRRHLELLNPWLQSSHVVPTRSPNPQEEGYLVESLGDRKLAVSWDGLCCHFESIYCNWDPDIFHYRSTTHLSISDTPSLVEGSPSIRTLPLRLRLLEKKIPDLAVKTETWILASRHFGESLDWSQHFMNISAYREGYQPGIQLADPVATTEMTNSPHVLLRLPVSDPSAEYVLEFGVRSTVPDFRMSVTILSRFEFQLDEAVPSLPYSETAEGRWSGYSAGGNHTFSTFIHNPQWAVAFQGRSAEVNLRMEVKASTATPVNIKAIRSNDKRVTELEGRDVLVQSGGYRYGHAVARASKLHVDSFTLIASAFSPGQEDDFTIKVESSRPFTLKLVAPEGAGRFSRTVTGTFSKGYTSPSRFRLEFNAGSVVSIRLEAITKPTSTPALRVALFEVSESMNSDSTDETLAASSGPFTDMISGALIKDIKLKPSTNVTYYAAVPEKRGSGDCDFRLTIFSTRPFRISG